MHHVTIVTTKQRIFKQIHKLFYTIMEAKINKSRLMKRAWYLVREKGYTLSSAMIKVWKEAKEYVAEKANEVKAVIEKAKLQTWWSTPEYKALKAIEDNKYKQFVADK